MRRLRAMVAIASTVCAFGIVVVAAAPADATTASLVNEPFTGVTTASPDWMLPASTGGGSNDACLSAAGNTSSSTPIPGCGTTAGSQAGLQLTPATTSQEGGVAYSSSVPSSLGLDVSFDTYQYAGSTPGADGIVFFLAASDPNNAAASPITLGPTGGSLGYSGTSFPPGGAGLTNGYLGIGLDVYGNYSNSAYDGSGCNDSQLATAESLTVRGPGNGTAGYCILSSQVAGAMDTASPPQAVPVNIGINPTDNDLHTAAGLDVPAHSYAVSVTPVGVTTPITATGQLPDASAFVTGSGWLDDNGVPQQLTFGWTASTGASTDYHTVSNVNVQTLNGTPPELTTGLSDNSGGHAQFGSTVTYTATPSVTQAAEGRTITLTDIFPTGLTPTATGLGGVGGDTSWSCGVGVDGQTVTCTHAGAPVDALPPVAMPVTVTASGSSPVKLSDTVTVGSPDAVQGSATDTETYDPVPTATVLSFVTQPQDSQVNTAMKNADGTTTQIQVAANVTAGGAVDPTYQGPVTLGFGANPGNAQFVVGGTPSSTMTVNALNGVADFTPVIVNAVGFGYTLQATASGLTSATSGSFSVSAAASSCPSGQSCTVTTTSTTGQTASVLAQPGTGNAVITATYGGNVAAIQPCNQSTASGILTFSGARMKVITLTIQTKLPVLLFCYGQPTPFLNILYRKTTYFNPVNQDYEGLLPLCLPKMTGPCVKSIGMKKQTETVVILSGADDPHITIG
jgi:hypothetical protein